MESEISKFKNRFNVPFYIPAKRLYINKFFIDKTVSIIVDSLTARNGFDLEYVNPLIWKIFDRMKTENIGYIIPAIYSKYSLSHCLPKKFLSDAIQKYGVIGEKLICKYMFEQTYSRKFSIAKLFWEFSRFDPCNDIRASDYIELCRTVHSYEVYDMFILDGKEGSEMKNFMWKINNINFSEVQYAEIIDIYTNKISDILEFNPEDERLTIFKEMISILEEKIAQMENNISG